MGRRIGLLLCILGLLTAAAGCSGSASPRTEAVSAGSTPTAGTATAASGQSPEDYLKYQDLKVKGEPEKFSVKVPKDWDVKLGEYPEGLFWRLANEYSRDAGLDLTPLKGSSVEVWRYALADGLRAPEAQNTFDYPSNAVLLVKSGKVAGAWLAFNLYSIGPSVKKRYLADITGLSFDNWVPREGLFADAGKNADLAAMEPTEVLAAFFKALNDGDKIRAYACQSPNELLFSLTMNIARQPLLYNPGFGANNSSVENIVMAKPASYKLMDPQAMTEIKEIGDRKVVEIAVQLQMRWRDNAFNTHTGDANGNETRFTFVTRYANGWKLQGLGTGP